MNTTVSIVLWRRLITQREIFPFFFCFFDDSFSAFSSDINYGRFLATRNTGRGPLRFIHKNSRIVETPFLPECRRTVPPFASLFFFSSASM